MDDVKTNSSNPSDYGYTYLTPREQPPAEVGWKDKEIEVKSGEVSLYSKNVLKDGDTTESVDRDSIANLSTTKQQWENIFSTNLKSPDDSNPKKKQAPKWEVKLPTSYRGVGANVNVDTGNNSTGQLGQPDVSSPVMEVVSNNNNNNNDDKAESYQNGGGDTGRHESAIEYEIRVAREREEMLRREKEERGKEVSSSSLLSSSSSSSTTQKSSGPITVLSSLEVVNGESESYQPAYNELAEADRAHDVWSLDGGVARIENKYEIKEIDPNESIIEREIRLQREKEAELEQQRLRLAQEVPSSSSSSSISSVQPQQQHEEGDFIQLAPATHSPSSGRMSPIQSVTVVHNEAPPSQESVIARELREFQEREEEMIRLRNSVHSVNIQKTDSPSNVSSQPSPSTQASSKSMSLNVTADNNNVHKSSLHSPSQTTNNSQGTWQREVSPFVSQKRRVSQDSGSSHSMGRASSDTATTPSRSISVQPIADGKEESDEDEKPDYFKKQESPFEREIRVAKERENELRRMKGMPELSHKDDYYGSYGAKTDKQEKGNDSPQIRHGGYQAPSQQTMKRVSTSRLHQEIQAQKERENSMRSEGKVISDSGELTKTSKYMEVTGSMVGGTENRNFVTKRSSVSYNSTQVAEVEKNTDVQKSKESSSPSVQGGSKKALGGGSQNFSYKEFRQTAESKIERELREMREREEELKTQRRASITQTPR